MRRFLTVSSSLSLFFSLLFVGSGAARLPDPGSQDKGIGPIKKVAVGPLDQPVWRGKLSPTSPRAASRTIAVGSPGLPLNPRHHRMRLARK